MKKSAGLFAIVFVALACLGLHSQVDASFILINNAGFELPVAIIGTHADPPGWTSTGTNIGNAGVWNITDSGGVYWTVPAPEGKQIGYLSEDTVDAPETFSQILSATLVDNTLYTLTGKVGHPLGFGGTRHPATIYTVAMWAGGNLLASISGTGPENSFDPFILTFNSGVSGYSGPLEIRLSSSQAQTGFDQLALDGSAVPLPPSLLLLGPGLLGLAGWRRFRKS